jgi:hypothetical protein
MTPADSVVGLGEDTLAVFKGRVLDFAMKSLEVSTASLSACSDVLLGFGSGLGWDCWLAGEVCTNSPILA